MMSFEEDFDVIVVGAGIEGSATAYNLARRGHNVALFDQFRLPHSHGSSHGETRITRKAYGQNILYSRMMNDAFKRTAELERESGQQLFVPCGYLEYGPENDQTIQTTIADLADQNADFEVFDKMEQSRRYPMFSYPDDYIFIHDKSGGILKADQMLQAFQSQFRKNGGVIRDGERVTDVIPNDIVIVKTSRRSYTCKSVVLALGPWAGTLLRSLGLTLPLQAQLIAVCYWKEKIKGEFNASKCPTFYERRGCENLPIFGSPSYEFPGLVKICLHHGPTVDPDALGEGKLDWVIDALSRYVAKHFPTLESRPSIVQTCLYTMTPDKNFILDTHPKWRNVVIGAGFSGHGFKLSPVVGEILADLATGRKPYYNIDLFKIDRFLKHKL